MTVSRPLSHPPTVHCPSAKPWTLLLPWFLPQKARLQGLHLLIPGTRDRGAKAPAGLLCLGTLQELYRSPRDRKSVPTRARHVLSTLEPCELGTLLNPFKDERLRGPASSWSRLGPGALKRQDACMHACAHTPVLSRSTLSPPQAPVVSLHVSFHTCARSATAGLPCTLLARDDKRGHKFTQTCTYSPKAGGCSQEFVCPCAGWDTQPQEPRLYLTLPGDGHPTSPDSVSTLPQGHPMPAPGRAGKRGRRPVLCAGISWSQVAVKETVFEILENGSRCSRLP